MVNQGGSFAQGTFSFIMRLLVSLVLPAWGLAMILLGVRAAAGWWIATVSSCWQWAPFSLPAVR
jgi:hypothetical protein